jgi:opacity protein-like surface antigen
VKLALALAAAAALLSASARADVVDLSGGSRRREPGATGFSVRAEFGNAYAPYGYVGGALSYLTEGLFAIEAGAGGGFPGVQLGVAVRKLFGERGTFVVTELSLAGNTKVARGGTGGQPTATSTSQNIWTSLGIGFDQRVGRWSVSGVVAVAFTPSDQQAHFGLHGGLGYSF